MPFLLRLLLVMLIAGGPSPLSAQTTARDGVVHGMVRGLVRGIVHDSLTGLPLQGALVQLAPRRPEGDTASDPSSVAVRAVTTDSLGRFHFTEVTPGSYTLGFFHDRLDALGLAPMVQSVDVPTTGATADGTEVEVVLALPSARTIRLAVCGDTLEGAVVGFVRDAMTGAPRGTARVTAEWLEVTLSAKGVTQQLQRRVQPVAETGWFALCRVPRSGAIMLSAQEGADSSARVEHEMLGDGLLPRDIYLGHGGTVDSTTTLPVLQGRVLRETDGQPLANALVRIGPLGAGVTGSATTETRTNATGRWRIPKAPAGSQTLEVRAVGYYPVVQPIDVVSTSVMTTAPVELTLRSMKAVLDTVRVVARYDRYRIATEFTERRQAGIGRFLTSAEIDRRRPIVVSDLFISFPGLFSERDSLGMPRITMRGVFADRCAPAIYVNGFEMLGFDTQDMDTFLRPEELLGVEVYNEASVPVQFKGGLRGCGALVFWTR